jgi:uncharacterized protein YfbU (UPF0304 family)
MATITLRVDDSTRNELERLSQARETSVSELLREAISDVLGTRRDLAPAESPRSMTMVDRRVLSLLHEILKRVDPDGESGDHARQIEALERGFTDEYAYEFGALEPELPLAECTLVHDILEMFTVLESSLGRLGDPAATELGEDARSVLEFAGFDLQDPRESRLLSYAKHLINTRRWENLANRFDSRHEHGNSHMRTLDRYQHMLAAYRSVVARRKAQTPFSFEVYWFEADDLCQVVDAAHAR